MSTAGIKFARKVPMAARELLLERAEDWTSAEWAMALNVTDAAIRHHASKLGVRTKPMRKRAHVTHEERLIEQSHAAEIAMLVQRRMQEAPEARPPKHRNASSVVQAGHRQASVLAEEPTICRLALVYARTPAGVRVSR